MLVLHQPYRVDKFATIFLFNTWYTRNGLVQKGNNSFELHAFYMKLLRYWFATLRHTIGSTKYGPVYYHMHPWIDWEYMNFALPIMAQTKNNSEFEKFYLITLHAWPISRTCRHLIWLRLNDYLLLSVWQTSDNKFKHASLSYALATVSPRWNGQHFANISKCIFLNETVWI